MVIKISSIKYSHIGDRWAWLKQQEKDKYSILDTDGFNYSCIGRRCYFCKNVLTKRDVCHPNIIYQSSKYEDLVSHGKCLAYTMEKYPDVPYTDLEGKIVRTKVDLSNV